MQKMVATVNQWAGVTDWKGLGQAATSPADASSRPAEGQDAPGSLLSSHFKNNAGNVVQKGQLAAPSVNISLIDALIEGLKKQGVVLDAVIDQLYILASEFTSLSLEEILRRIIGIVASAVLESTQNIISTLFDIISEVANTILQILDTPVYIPVLSDVLEFFGVSIPSMFDMLCWIAAVPATLAYKVINNEAPFRDDEFSAYLINAKSFNQIREAFIRPKIILTSVQNASHSLIPVTLSADAGQVFYADASSLKATAKLLPDLGNYDRGVYIMGRAVAGIFSLLSAFVTPFEVVGSNSTVGALSAVIGAVSAAANGATAVLIPKMPIQNEIVAWTNASVTGVGLIAKILFSGPIQSRLSTTTPIMRNLRVSDGRATGAIVNAILILPALACSCYHFYEISQKEANTERSIAIIDETSNLTSYISRFCYAIAVNTFEPVTETVSVGVMTVSTICTAGLQIASAAIKW